MSIFDWFRRRREPEPRGISEESFVYLIVGLGNPGPEYEATRHNAGFWFVDELARRYNAQFVSDKKCGGDACRVTIDGLDVRMLKPMTFMNRSGQPVRALAQYYDVPVGKILVVHDEIDLPPGTVKLKQGGGHGGHNGLRDIVSHLGRDFARLRIGVGHPGHKDDVVDYVLKRPSRSDDEAIRRAIDEAADVTPDLLRAGFQKAMTTLHTK